MVQASLYQLVLDRKCGEYELPDGASLIACSNRESDRGVVHRMPAPLSNRFVHLEIRVDAPDWLEWAAANRIAAQVIFFVSMRPELLHCFDPRSREAAFASPRTWEFISDIVKRRNGLDPSVERALFRGTVGEAAAVEFSAFLKVWRELPHPRTVIDDPENAAVPENASALIALCGSLYRMADDTRHGLRGVKLVIADDHKGLKAAATRILGATSQRCRVHFIRNLLAMPESRAGASSPRSSPPPSPRTTQTPPLPSGAWSPTSSGPRRQSSLPSWTRPSTTSWPT